MSLALIRDGRPGDVNLVVNSWITSHAAFTKADGHVVRYVHHPALVLDLVQRCSVVVACDPDDHDEVYGWLCHELVKGELVIHYLFVKFPFRRSGIADQLYEHVATGRPFTATHAGFLMPELRAKYVLIFDPYSPELRSK